MTLINTLVHYITLVFRDFQDEQFRNFEIDNTRLSDNASLSLSL